MRRSAFAVALVMGVLSLGMVGAAVADATPVAKRVVRLADKITAVGHPVAGSKAGFKLAATVPAGDKLTGFAINYGDHTKVAKGKKPAKTASHVYRSAGTYTVSFTVTDNHHRAAKAMVRVRIVASMPAGGGPQTGGGSNIDVSQCHWDADGQVSDSTYAACLRIPCSLVDPVNYFSCADRVGEFDDPGWTALPSPSVFNTTPSCPVDGFNAGGCTVSLLDAPPPDPGNGEWSQRIKNPDGTWNQNGTGYLNSAYWPSEKRPDLENYAVPAAAKDCASRTWHYCYLSGAQATGYPIGHAPAVGELAVYPGECAAYAWDTSVGQDNPGAACDPSTNMDWYVSYVEQVNPDGTWIGSGAGLCIPACRYGENNQDTAYDSGIVVQVFAPAMDAYTDFIGLLPVGSAKP